MDTVAFDAGRRVNTASKSPGFVSTKFQTNRTVISCPIGAPHSYTSPVVRCDRSLSALHYFRSCLGNGWHNGSRSYAFVPRHLSPKFCSRRDNLKYGLSSWLPSNWISVTFPISCPHLLETLESRHQCPARTRTRVPALAAFHREKKEYPVSGLST